MKCRERGRCGCLTAKVGASEARGSTGESAYWLFVRTDLAKNRLTRCAHFRPLSIIRPPEDVAQQHEISRSRAEMLKDLPGISGMRSGGVSLWLEFVCLGLLWLSVSQAQGRIQGRTRVIFGLASLKFLGCSIVNLRCNLHAGDAR